MTYREVLALPLRTFWSFNRQVDRLRAEADQRLMRVHSAAQSADGAKALLEALNVELDSPVVAVPRLDESKFRELQAKYNLAGA